LIPEKNIDELSRDKLQELLINFAKNWLAHDGCWFLAIEEKYGMEMAIDMDREAWRKFSAVEAKRVKQFLQLGEYSGIEGLKKALAFRLYASLNEDRVDIVNDNTVRYYVKTCRVQEARRRKGMPDFPCKSVGIVEYSVFAKDIDNRFETKCLSCPPEIEDDGYHCIWEFTLTK
jgi:hypothetical protein